MKVLFTQQQVDGLKTKHFSATLSEYLVLKFGDDVILCRYGFSEYASVGYMAKRIQMRKNRFLALQKMAEQVRSLSFLFLTTLYTAVNFRAISVSDLWYASVLVHL